MHDCASLECLVGISTACNSSQNNTRQLGLQFTYCILTCTVYDLIMKLHNVACTMVICYFVDNNDDDDMVDELYNKL